MAGEGWVGVMRCPARQKSHRVRQCNVMQIRGVQQATSCPKIQHYSTLMVICPFDNDIFVCTYRVSQKGPTPLTVGFYVS